MSFVRRLVLAVAAVLLTTAVAHAAPKRAPVEVKGVVNLNTAGLDELRRLPGVGPKKAQGIIAARAVRPFASPDQVMKVKGIGRKMYRRLKPHLAVSGATTLVRVSQKAIPPEEGGSRTSESPELSLPAAPAGS